MSIRLYLNSDNLAVIDKVTDPLTGQTDISDATVTVTLYESDGTTPVADATALSAAWNATIVAYVAVIPDIVVLVKGATYILKATIVKGTNKRTKVVTCRAVEE